MKGVLNVKTVKLNITMIKVLIKSRVNSLRQALLYLTNKASLKVKIGMMVKLNNPKYLSY